MVHYGSHIVTACPRCGFVPVQLDTHGGQEQEVYEGKCPACKRDWQIIDLEQYDSEA